MFLQGQGVQSPLVLEAVWLVVGHVDEFVQCLPFGNELGWTIGIADTGSALELFENGNRNGHGGIPAISFNGTAGPGDFISPGLGPEDLTVTIDKLLANETFLNMNEYAQRHINSNLEILLSEVPLPRKHINRVPTLFRPPVWDISNFTTSTDRFTTTSNPAPTWGIPSNVLLASDH
ncbi:hypothetical protein BJX70DRAFT_394549 [Aspergillus crustosus]